LFVGKIGVGWVSAFGAFYQDSSSVTKLNFDYLSKVIRRFYG